MLPETMMALARMSEMNRRLFDPTTTHRDEASRLQTAAQRARRRAVVAHVHRAVHTAARGRRVRGPAAA